MQLAFVCRYGHQDVYRLLARDPAMRPLTPLELALYERCLREVVTEEFRVRAGVADATGNANDLGD